VALDNRMVSIKDVARQAGVSVGTVSNVINRPDMVSTDTRSRVRAVIERLGYVRSESARQLRVGRSRVVALLVLDMSNPFFVELARGAERAARAATKPYASVCSTSVRDTSRSIRCWRRCSNTGLRGN